MSAEFVSNEEIVRAARRRLPQGPWDYLVAASESDTTMRRNRLAFDRLGFRPRVLADVSSVDPSSTFLGQALRIPVMLAPVGSLQVFIPEGGAVAARAAGVFRTIHVVSSVTELLSKRFPPPRTVQRYSSSIFTATGSGRRT